MVSSYRKIIYISIILCGLTISWYQNWWSMQTHISIYGVLLGWVIGLLLINYNINYKLLRDPLQWKSDMSIYPWYKIVLFGLGVVGVLLYVTNSFDKLIGCFAVASIVLGLDQRWAGFAAGNLLVLAIVMNLVGDDILSYSITIYLYYMLIIAGVTQLQHNIFPKSINQ